LKVYKKKDIIENYKEYFAEKGFTEQHVKLMKKEKLCDIIYGEDSEFVVPEDFEEKNCGLYDMGTLTRIAVRKHIDTTRYKTQEELCRAIHVTYVREKSNFNTEKNPEWDTITSKDEAMNCMIPMKGDKRLQEHQMRVVKHILTHRALLAIHATGTGKTLTAVASINCMLAKYPNIKIIIITPLSLVDNIKKEIKRFGLDLLNNPELYTRVEIYSYDEYVNLQKRKRTVECKNTFLIIDEAHNIRTDINIKETKLDKGSKSYVIMNCAAECFKVLLLTATPIINNIFDVRNLLMMLEGTSPDKTPPKKDFIKNVESSLGHMVNCKVSYYDPPLDENYPKRIDNIVDMYMEPEYFNKYKEIETKYYDPSIEGNC
jgi:SNF2 family DNA or RNA helicase